jgi:WXG100 family type VII secretion target
MDVAVVRQAATAIDSNARDLDRVIGAVEGLVNDIAGSWYGDAATEFHEAWAHRHRAELSALAAALRGYAHTARTNADAQDRTSAADGSAGTSSAGGRGGNGWLAPAATAGEAILDLMGRTPRDVGRYPKAWENLLKQAPASWANVLKHAPEGFQQQFANLPDEVLRYKQWGIVHGLNHLDGLVTGAGRVSGGLNVAADGYSTVQDLRNHDSVNATFDGASTAADVLKTSKVGYLGGVAVQSWVQAGKAAQNVDWSSEGMSEVLHASPGDWASAFGDAAKQMPGQLAKIFL